MQWRRQEMRWGEQNMIFLVIFENFTVTLAAAAECTEFPKFEEGRLLQFPIGSDATADMYRE